jgi:hypothetical protein
MKNKVLIEGVSADSAAGALVTVGSTRRLIHMGRMFTAGLFDAALADDATLEFLIRVPEGVSTHIWFGAEALNSVRLQVFEAPTIDDQLEGDDGTPMTPANRNRASEAEPQTELYSAPTVLADGDELWNRIVSRAVNGDANFVFPEGEYLVRVTNIESTAQPVGATFDFYEV